MGKRLKGIGLGMIFNGYTVIVYYVAILGWVFATPETLVALR